VEAEVNSSTGLSPRVAAPLAYAGWWVTGAIFWLVERRDDFVRFHAAQAVAAFGITAVLVLAFFGLAAASLSFMPSAFILFMWTAAIVWGVGMLVWLVVMWKAAHGEVWQIPLAGLLAARWTGQESGIRNQA